MEELQQCIENELPPEGEWFHDGHEKFSDAAKAMVDAGITTYDIKDILQNLYYAVMNEYEG